MKRELDEFDTDSACVVLYAFSKSQELRSLDRAYFPASRCCHRHINLHDYRVTGTEILAFGQRGIHVDATAEAGIPSCGIIRNRVPLTYLKAVATDVQTFNKNFKPGPASITGFIRAGAGLGSYEQNPEEIALRR